MNLEAHVLMKHQILVVVLIWSFANMYKNIKLLECKKIPFKLSQEVDKYIFKLSIFKKIDN